MCLSKLGKLHEREWSLSKREKDPHGRQEDRSQSLNRVRRVCQKQGGPTIGCQNICRIRRPSM